MSNAATRAISIREGWLPPPAVAGDTPKPYPAYVTARHSWITPHEALQQAVNERLQRELPPLAADARAAVGLRGLTHPLFARGASTPWDVFEPGYRSLLAHIQRTSFTPPHFARPAGMDHYLEVFLGEWLGDHNWFAPAHPPSVVGALTSFFTQAYLDTDPTNDPVFPGERARAAAIAQRCSDDPFEPWRSRPSRRYVELMIAATGRVAPYRLRPLVLTKRNAARSEWHYGAWGVYDALSNGDAGAFLSLYGHSAVGQEDCWHQVLWDGDRFPRPEPHVPGTEIEWYGLHLRRPAGRVAFPEVRCAMTDAVLAEWSPAPAADARPSDAFVPMHGDVPELDDDDTYEVGPMVGRQA